MKSYTRTLPSSWYSSQRKWPDRTQQLLTALICFFFARDQACYLSICRRDGEQSHDHWWVVQYDSCRAKPHEASFISAHKSDSLSALARSHKQVGSTQARARAACRAQHTSFLSNPIFQSSCFAGKMVNWWEPLALTGRGESIASACAVCACVLFFFTGATGY